MRQCGIGGIVAGQKLIRWRLSSEGSGISREEFCSRNDIPLKTLCRYVTRYSEAGDGGRRHATLGRRGGSFAQPWW
jgi:hypothetical protein